MSPFQSIIKILLLFSINKAISISRYNVSMAELASCKEYRIPSGYAYRNFFLIEDLLSNKQSDEKLSLKFYVMTTKDAHILLSSIDNPKKGDRVYEIVIGGGLNTFSVIRPNIQSGRLVLVNKNDILSPLHPTPIVIRQTIDGVIEITVPGSEGPALLLSYKDKIPVAIKYVSFTSYGSTPALWFYDCDNDKADNIEMEKQNLTDIQRLQEDLFRNYSIFTKPIDLEKIHTSFTIRSIDYDSSKSILTTRLELNMTWMDSGLRWNSSDYGNHKGIRTQAFPYWTPDIMIMNGAKEFYTNFFLAYTGTVQNYGLVKVDSAITVVKSWCVDGSINWPFDDLHCNIVFGVHGHKLNLIYNEDYNITTAKLTELTEWHLVDVRILNRAVNSSEWNSEYQSDPIESDLILKLRLRRNQNFYRKVFFTPLYVSSVLLLLTFALTGYKRGLLNMISMLTLIISLVVLMQHAPSTYVPKLMRVYQALLLITCFTYCLHIMIRWLTEFNFDTKPNAGIMAIINFFPLRFILGMSYYDATEYLKIQEEPWKEVACILNRILFVALGITCLALFCLLR